MERVPAATEEADDPVEATLASWNFERSARDQCEAAQSSQEREKQLFVLCVVGNVEKCGVGATGAVASSLTGDGPPSTRSSRSGA
jgi:hypothetical protein